MKFLANIFSVFVLFQIVFAETENEIEVLTGVSINNWPYMEQVDNDRYIGYGMDLMNEISNKVGFQYKMYLAPDHMYGGHTVGKRVTGMIGEVYHNRADFAVADITVTEKRKELVDFTEPIMSFSIVILIHKSRAENITSFKDLAEQTDISYGVIGRGSTYRLFERSTDPTLQKMFLEIKKKENIVKNTKEGIDRVAKTPFAFLMESASSKLVTGMHCDLTYIEDMESHFPGNYAIVMPKNSKYTSKFNSAINELKESGQLSALQAKYWRNNC